MAYCVCATAIAATSTPENTRTKYNFNPSWLLHIGDIDPAQVTAPAFNDARWQKITLPRAFNEDEAFRVSIGDLTDTIVWYRKHFKLPANARGKKVFLEFEGIRFGGKFWLNGQYVGIHENGVMAFGLDITDCVRFGNADNVLAVRIDNSWEYREEATGYRYRWNNAAFNANYGGIPKNVYLHVCDRLYQTLPLFSNLQTTGTYIYAREIDITRRNALICAEMQVRNEYPEAKEFIPTVRIEDAEGKTISEFQGETTKLEAGDTAIVKLSQRVDSLHFWSWGYGYLYKVYTSLITKGETKTFKDEVCIRTGFRKTAFRDGFLRLNDRPIMIHGYAQRTSNEWPAVGMSVPPWMSDLSNGLMLASNANMVRWMHVTPWKQDVASCDRLGLMQLMPAGDAEGDSRGRYWENRVSLMRDAIIYNRNSPSIVCYEAGNRTVSEEHIAEMKALRDRYDPYGGRAIGSREMLDSRIAEYGGDMLYVNKSGGKPLWAQEYCRDEAPRMFWDSYSYPFHHDGFADDDTCRENPYNRNQESFFREDVARWADYYRIRPGTGKRVSAGALNIIFTESNTHYRGTDNYRRSGEADALRIPKEAWFAHQAVWDGWVDIERHHTYICGHWNYPPNTVKPLYVVSTSDSVALFVNSKPYSGAAERENAFLFKFKDVHWQTGCVEAVGYDAKGNEQSRCKKETAGEPAALRLTLMTAPNGLHADGADMAIVEVEIVDSQGRRCPLNNDTISFRLEGAAEWRGGMARIVNNGILATDLPVEGGVNRIMLRSTTTAGSIRLVATDLNNTTLPQASLSFKSLPVKVSLGLSSFFPDEQLPLNLARGETPTGVDFTLGSSLATAQIVEATAFPNDVNARLSFDDNEQSAWTFDSIAPAWLKYELSRDAVVAAIELKMNNFRFRQYRIKVYTDDELTCEGETPLSLGYFRLPLRPVRGRFVKLVLEQISKPDAPFAKEPAGVIETDIFIFNK